MAIDKNATKNLIAQIDDLFDTVTRGIDQQTKTILKKSLMGPAFSEISKLIAESRPPVLYIMGRSGHGKSSFINALSGKTVAEVGDIKPTTPESIPYYITFEEVYSTWQVIDSRGIFETTTPDGAIPKDTISLIKEDILKYKPDVILHVISAPEIRALAEDLKNVHAIMSSVKQQRGTTVPTIIALNRVDTLGNPREWPPESNAKKAALIHEALEYMTYNVLQVNKQNIDLNSAIYGYELRDDTYIGMIPICSLEGDLWNIETLSEFIGQHLPESTLLDFYQAQQRKQQLKKISDSLIKRFSSIATGIGSTPIPVADMIILTPLQLLLIALIGGLSCRSFSKETAYEYLAAAGINIGAAIGFRETARQLSKLIPFAGWAVSGTIAGASTYMIGKSAERYFFHGEIKRPDTFKKEWKKIENLNK